MGDITYPDEPYSPACMEPNAIGKWVISLQPDGVFTSGE
jgi:hypothetical protein